MSGIYSYLDSESISSLYEAHILQMCQTETHTNETEVSANPDFLTPLENLHEETFSKPSTPSKTESTFLSEVRQNVQLQSSAVSPVPSTFSDRSVVQQQALAQTYQPQYLALSRFPDKAVLEQQTFPQTYQQSYSAPLTFGERNIVQQPTSQTFQQPYSAALTFSNRTVMQQQVPNQTYCPYSAQPTLSNPNSILQYVPTQTYSVPSLPHNSFVQQQVSSQHAQPPFMVSSTESFQNSYAPQTNYSQLLTQFPLRNVRTDYILHSQPIREFQMRVHPIVAKDNDELPAHLIELEKNMILNLPEELFPMDKDLYNQLTNIKENNHERYNLKSKNKILKNYFIWCQYKGKNQVSFHELVDLLGTDMKVYKVINPLIQEKFLVEVYPNQAICQNFFRCAAQHDFYKARTIVQLKKRKVETELATERPCKILKTRTEKESDLESNDLFKKLSSELQNQFIELHSSHPNLTKKLEVLTDLFKYCDENNIDVSLKNLMFLFKVVQKTIENYFTKLSPKPLPTKALKKHDQEQCYTMKK